MTVASTAAEASTAVPATEAISADVAYDEDEQGYYVLLRQSSRGLYTRRMTRGDCRDAKHTDADAWVPVPFGREASADDWPVFFKTEAAAQKAGRVVSARILTPAPEATVTSTAAEASTAVPPDPRAIMAALGVSCATCRWWTEPYAYGAVIERHLGGCARTPEGRDMVVNQNGRLVLNPDDTGTTAAVHDRYLLTRADHFCAMHERREVGREDGSVK